MRRPASSPAWGRGVTKFKPGDRVIVFHHIPCGYCFYCARKLYAQCPVYKKVGVTAGFEPAGGGFAQYVRVMDWIVKRGVEEDSGRRSVRGGLRRAREYLPEGRGAMRSAARRCGPGAGPGPIGLLFTMLLKLRGCTIVATDTILRASRFRGQCGATFALDPRTSDVPAKLRALDGRPRRRHGVRRYERKRTGRGGCSLSRPGAKIMLFAQTSDKERIELSGASICVGERSLLGSYSASVDLQKESADLVFSGSLPVHLLISHRVPLDKIEFAFRLATHPGRVPR
jgi:L-iditol 2-dehydrogenase